MRDIYNRDWHQTLKSCAVSRTCGNGAITILDQPGQIDLARFEGGKVFEVSLDLGVELGIDGIDRRAHCIKNCVRLLDIGVGLQRTLHMC